METKTVKLEQQVEHPIQKEQTKKQLPNDQYLVILKSKLMFTAKSISNSRLLTKADMRKLMAIKENEDEITFTRNDFPLLTFNDVTILIGENLINFKMVHILKENLDLILSN